MAKVAPGVVNPLGVLNGRVYYFLNGKLISRALPKAGTKKNEPAFKKQHIRTSILNGFAKGVNDAIDCYDYGLKSSKFYSNILKRFRREANNNRLMLLSELPGLEVNDDYSLESYGTRPEINIRDQNDLTVELKACYHPRPPSRVKFDCYYFEVILLWWKGSDKICDHTSIKTEWVQKRDTLPEFDVKFPIHKNATDYLIVLGQHLGKREIAIETMPSKAIRIMAAGSFKASGKKLLVEKELARKKKQEEAERSGNKPLVKIREEARVRRKN